MRREINFVKNIVLSNVKRLEAPYKLTMAVTYRCNSRCEICHIWKKKTKNELTLAEMEKFFTKNDFFNWIDIVGGEVFIRNDLVSLIRIIVNSQKNLYLLHIPTNGIMTNKIVEDVKNILALKPTRFIISISLDGPKHLHDKLRGIKNNWNYAVNTYKELKKLESNRFEVYFGMTLSKYNYGQIEKAYEELKQVIPNFHRNSIHFNIAHNSSNYYENNEINLGISADVLKALESYNSKKQIKISPVQWLENKYQSRINKYIKTNKCPLSCRALSSSLFIDPLGNIYPCIMWNCKMTNIKDVDFSINKMWKNKKTLDIYHKINKEKCPHCWTPCEAYQTILGNIFQT